MNADVSLSKAMSLVLRHAPEKAGLVLQDGGWVAVEDLLAGLARMGKPVSREALQRVVQDNDKKRFGFSDDGLRIRAVQGHSVDVEMGYAPADPPEILYHGTADRFLGAIMAEGLKPMSRQFVHLSADAGTALKVGQRHGRPCILVVQSGAMKADGAIFHVAQNGVWLTASVPPSRLSRLVTE